MSPDFDLDFDFELARRARLETTLVPNVSLNASQSQTPPDLGKCEAGIVERTTPLSSAIQRRLR